jgi:hypothetical protein
MTRKEFTKVRDTVDNEGFDYCFINYSNFDEIEDEEFHRLRKQYVSAAKQLNNYLGIEY